MTRKLASLLTLLVLLVPGSARALGTAFTHQGRLLDGGAPASGAYDLEFKLYDAATGGALVGTGTVAVENVPVSGGLFSVELDFGAAAFDGGDRWLEIGVRPGSASDPDPYTPLAPRQPVTPTPYALYAASSASVSGSFSGEVTGSQGGTVVSNAVAANTSGAIVRRDGTGSFAAGSLSLSGNLNLEQTTSASVGVVTKGGAPFLHDFGSDNTFLGSMAGNLSLTGASNTALGANALSQLTTGFGNIAIGFSSGNGLQTGSNNIYLGGFPHPEESNTIRIGGFQPATYLGGTFRLLRQDGPPDNTFIGKEAGNMSLTGGTNLGLGTGALNELTSGGFNVAIGTDALGLLTEGFGNIAIGNVAGSGLLTGSNNIYLGGFPHPEESNTIRIGGFQPATYLGGTFRLLRQDGPPDNTFIGKEAGNMSLTGGTNLGFGTGALNELTSGGFNVAIGTDALGLLTEGFGNIAIGNVAGSGLLTGSNNIYLGGFPHPEESNTIRIGGFQPATYLGGTFRLLRQDGPPDNTFIGKEAGNMSLTGGTNLGLGTGALNELTSGGFNVAIGTDALGLLTEGFGNIAIGNVAGSGLLTGSNNIYLGGFPHPEESNTIRIGGFQPATYLGGTFRLLRLDGPPDNTFIGKDAGNMTLSGGTNLGFGTGALNDLTSGGFNVAIGTDALGQLTDGFGNIAIGPVSGSGLLSGSNNIYLGGFPHPEESNTVRIGSGQTDTHLAGTVHVPTAVGIGLGGAPTFQLQLATDSAAKPTSNTWTISSDRRLKKNVATIESPLDRLLRLRGVTYQWIQPEKQGGMTGTYMGLIAQEVEPVFPEWVREGKDGFKTLTVSGFEGLTVEALRQVRSEKDAEIARLEGRVSELADEVRELKALLLEVAGRSQR